MWKTRICIFVSALIFLAPVGVIAQDEVVEPVNEQELPEKQSSYGTYYSGWQIDGFDAFVSLQADGSLLVKETIDTQFNPERNKHGIFREIPFVYTDKLHNRVKVDLNVLEVTQNGVPATYNVSNVGSYKNIKIGDGNIEIGGPVQYQLTYEVDRAILFFEEYDEIYWNVTGDLWEVPIQNVSAFVTLPETAEIIQVDCYTGRYGNNGDDCGFASGENEAAFAASDFLTVAVGFSKGVITEPTWEDRVGYFLKDNWVGVIPIFVIFAIGLFWFIAGRDPRMGTIIAEFEPPENIKAVYAGFLVFNRYTTQFNAAMIVQLAVDGYLKIIVKEKEGKRKTRAVSLEKLKTSKGLDPIHKDLFDTMFGKKDRVTMGQIKINVGRKLTIAQLKKDIEKKFIAEKLYTSQSFLYRTVLGAFIAVPLALFPFITGNAHGTFSSSMFIAAAVVAAIFGWLMPKRTLKGTKLARQVLGFKDFMHTAERYRSEWQEEKGIFTKYLPYAIAFNDVKRWAKTFEGLDVAQPSWYSSNMAMFSAMNLADSLGKTTRSLGTAMAPQSQSSGGSSGSSGGGFSGGGFGGGGGGSW